MTPDLLESAQEHNSPGERSCSQCGCGEAEINTCPFAEEIHNDDSTCVCCAKCRHQCQMDI